MRRVGREGRQGRQRQQQQQQPGLHTSACLGLPAGPACTAACTAAWHTGTTRGGKGARWVQQGAALPCRCACLPPSTHRHLMVPPHRTTGKPRVQAREPHFLSRVPNQAPVAPRTEGSKNCRPPRVEVSDRGRPPRTDVSDPPAPMSAGDTPAWMRELHHGRGGQGRRRLGLGICGGQVEDRYATCAGVVVLYLTRNICTTTLSENKNKHKNNSRHRSHPPTCSAQTCWRSRPPTRPRSG